MRLLSDGNWWPDEDVECHKAIGFMDDLDKALDFVPREKRKLAFQAGGNMGVWANDLVAYGFDEVWTVEARWENYICLLRNVAPEVKAIWAALGAMPGTTGMAVDPRNAGGCFLSGEGRIPVITIDSLELPACDFLALDIEGSEPMAITGARDTIARFRPVILVEDRGHSMRYGHRAGWSHDLPGYTWKELKRDTLLLPC